MLKLSNLMQCIVHVPEIVPEPPYDFLGFFARSLLMLLHRQKYKVCMFGPLVIC